jgi:hypothetical protein
MEETAYFQKFRKFYSSPDTARFTKCTSMMLLLLLLLLLLQLPPDDDEDDDNVVRILVSVKAGLVEVTTKLLRKSL